MKHKLKLLLACLLLVYSASAQNTRQISIDEAIQLSLQNSKQLKLNSAKVSEAIATWHESQNSMLPDIKAQGAYLGINQPNIDLKTGSSSGGGSTDTTSKKTTGFNVDHVAYGMVTASLPLFSGLRIHYGIQSAKYLAEAAKLDAEHDREAIIQNTIDAYNNLYKSKKAVEIVEANLKQSQQRVSDFSNMEKNGLMARNDLLKAQLQESNIELSLLDAQNNWRMSNFNMDLMLGLPENTELATDSFQAVEANTKNMNDWELTALQNRQDLKALSFREKAANAGIKSAKGEYFPSIALTGGYVALDIPNFATITNAIDYGVGLQYNLGSLWKTGAKVAQAKARMQQTLASEEMLNDQVRLQINRAYANYLLTQKKVEVYTKAVEQATENYKITKNKYDNSLATTTDLLDADAADLQAKLNYAFAKADAVVAYKKLLQTAGILTTKKNN